MPEPATRLLRTLAPEVSFVLLSDSSLTPRLHENASMQRYPRICFHQYHRRSTTDFECATTSCSSSHSRYSMYRFHIVLTTTLDPTTHSNSVHAITTLQASISPSDCVCLVDGHSFITDPLRCLACLCGTANELLGGYTGAVNLQQNSF